MCEGRPVVRCITDSILRPPALPAGVPCLTLAGQCHAHNVGVSLLTAMGLQHDWVAHSGADMLPLHAVFGAWMLLIRIGVCPPPQSTFGATATPAAVDEYVAKAVALASDLPKLSELRGSLRQRMLQVRLRSAAAPASAQHWVGH